MLNNQQTSTTTGSQGAESIVPTTTQTPTTTGAQGAESIVTPTTTKKVYSSLMDQIVSDMDALMRDIQSNLPNISSSQVINLVNSGVNISDIIPTFGNKNNVSKYKSPSTDIIEIDFKGTSNVYSPYIYYDKNLSEKFDSVKKYR